MGLLNLTWLHVSQDLVGQTFESSRFNTIIDADPRDVTLDLKRAQM